MWTQATCVMLCCRMGLTYVDRYLINSHLGGKILETWDAMIEMQQQGLIRWAGLHVCTHVGPI